MDGEHLRRLNPVDLLHGLANHLIEQFVYLRVLGIEACDLHEDPFPRQEADHPLHDVRMRHDSDELTLVCDEYRRQVVLEHQGHCLVHLLVDFDGHGCPGHDAPDSYIGGFPVPPDLVRGFGCLRGPDHVHDICHANRPDELSSLVDDGKGLLVQSCHYYLGLADWLILRYRVRGGTHEVCDALVPELVYSGQHTDDIRPRQEPHDLAVPDDRGAPDAQSHELLGGLQDRHVLLQLGAWDHDMLDLGRQRDAPPGEERGVADKAYGLVTLEDGDLAHFAPPHLRNHVRYPLALADDQRGGAHQISDQQLV